MLGTAALAVPAVPGHPSDRDRLARCDLHKALLPSVQSPGKVSGAMSDRVGAAEPGWHHWQGRIAPRAPGAAHCHHPRAADLVFPLLYPQGNLVSQYWYPCISWGPRAGSSGEMLAAALDLLLGPCPGSPRHPTELRLQFLAWFSPHSTLTCLWWCSIRLCTPFLPAFGILVVNFFTQDLR